MHLFSKPKTKDIKESTLLQKSTITQAKTSEGFTRRPAAAR